MAFGVINTGFNEKTVEDVIAEIEDALRAAFGADLDTSADSVLGVLIGTFSDQIAQNWEVSLAVYRSLYPDSASGEALDNVAAITGAVRLPPTESTTPLKLNLDDTVLVPAGSLVSVGATGAQFETLVDLTNSTGFQATLEIAAESVDTGPITGNEGSIDTIQSPVAGWTAKSAVDARNAEPYALVNSETLDLEVDQGATQTVTFLTGDFATIGAATALEIATVINANTTGITAADEGGILRIVSDTDGTGSAIQATGGDSVEALGLTFSLRKGFNFDTPAETINGASETFALADGETLSMIVDGGSLQIATFNTGEFVAIGAATAIEVAKVINAEITGVRSYEVGGKVVIESLTGGTQSEIEITGGTANVVLNFPEIAFGGVSGDAVLGRDEETDAELRIRRIQLLQAAGAATVDAIRAAILQVIAVVQATVFENTSDVTDVNGLPPHSIEAVVQGGDSVDVAQSIFDTKAAGIATHRDPGPDGRTEIITDSQGTMHDINFSIPTEVPIFLDIDITIDPNMFGGGDQTIGEELVKQALRATGRAAAEIGSDVIARVLSCAPLPPLGVAGVLDVPVLRLDTSAAPVSTTNITIDTRELATYSTADMTVNIV